MLSYHLLRQAGVTVCLLMKKLYAYTPLLLLLSGCGVHISTDRNLTIMAQATKNKLSRRHFQPCVIPFQMQYGQVVVTLHMDAPVSADVNLIVDTGAPTTLSEDFANRYHIPLKEIRNQKMQTPGGSNSKGKKTESFARHISFQLGNSLRITKPHVFVSPLTAPTFLCQHADGLLGSDALSAFGCYIDFKKQQIILYDKDAQPAAMLDSFPYQLPFDRSLFVHTPALHVQVQDTAYRAAWDMGCTTYMAVIYGRGRKGKLDTFLMRHPQHTQAEVYNAHEDLSAVVTASSDDYYVPADTLQFGSARVPLHKGYAVYTYNNGLPINMVLLGLPFMQQFDVFISWKDSKIYLRPRPQLPGTPDMPTTPRATVRYTAADSSAYIASIGKTYTLYASGLRAGDILLSLDGQAVPALLSATHTSPCEAGKVLTAALLQSKKIIVKHKDQTQEEVRIP